MRFGAVPVDEARGAILAHSVSVSTGRLRKGRSLTDDDLERLVEAGVETVVVARLDAGDIHENDAALSLAEALVPDRERAGLRLSKPATGRVNIYATGAGVADIAAGKINALNAVDPMITVATVPEWQRMAEGGMVATVKIISYGVPEDALRAACDIGADALKMRAATVKTAQLIQTTIAGDDGAKGHEAIEARVNALGVDFMAKTLVPHEVVALAEAIEESPAEVVLILTGSATSDMNDVAPEAVRRAGGDVHHFGMPVDPGNLLFLGAHRGRPVIGLPGCARSPALNGADWVLERTVCGVAVTAADIQAMGVGGLLKEIPSRPRPRDIG